MTTRKTSAITVRGKLFRAAAAAVLMLELSACGGGGGGGGGGGSSSGSSNTTGSGTPASTSPYISAAVVSINAGGDKSYVAVIVKNKDLNGSAISNATVVVNGNSAAYSTAELSYGTPLTLSLGNPVTVAITVNGQTYTASGFQHGSYPTITNPSSGSLWNASSPNNLTWVGSASSSNSGYLLEILDTNGAVAWPLPEKTFTAVSASTNFYTVGANSLSAGSYAALVGQTKVQTIENAASGSVLTISAFDLHDFSVTTSMAGQQALTQSDQAGASMQAMPTPENLPMQAARAMLDMKR